MERSVAMPYNISVSIQFEAASQADADAIIKGWNLADGTNVFVSASEVLASGIVEGGEIIPPEDIPPAKIAGSSYVPEATEA